MQKSNRKKVALYIPNLSCGGSGGAETYGIGIAEALSGNYDITIYARANKVLKSDISDIYTKLNTKKYTTRFIHLVSIGPKHPRLRLIANIQLIFVRKEIEKNYDLFINCTQGELMGCNNIPSIHIVHFPDIPAERIFPKLIGRVLDRNYLNSYELFLANSEFTKKWFEKYWLKECSILNPPSRICSQEDIKWEEKENIILAVSRIVPDKKVMEMIIAFKKLVDTYHCNYRFVIIGNSSSKYAKYANQITESIGDYPIEIYSNVLQNDLLEWYKRAKVFWHAKGLGVDNSDPFDMEHFGMTTVEAMSYGCVPVVINRGGQVEIVDDGCVGRRWNTIDELIVMTNEIINNEEIMKIYSENAIKKSNKYQMQCFKRNLCHFVHEVLK